MNRTPRNTAARTAILGATAAVLIAACGGTDSGSGTPSSPSTCGRHLTQEALRPLCGAEGVVAGEEATFRVLLGVVSNVNQTRYDNGPTLVDDRGQPIVVGYVRGEPGRGFQLSRFTPEGDLLILDIVDYMGADAEPGGITDCLTDTGGSGFTLGSRAYLVQDDSFVPTTADQLHDCSPQW